MDQVVFWCDSHQTGLDGGPDLHTEKTTSPSPTGGVFGLRHGQPCQNLVRLWKVCAG